MKVLIIDDSVVFRILLSNLIRGIDGIGVCGTASDGEEGLIAVENHHPDVVLLDVEMPKMTGLDVIKEFNHKGIKVSVIMCSAFTVAGADVTVKALELGAHDFITKPEGRDKNESLQMLKDQLVPKLTQLKAGYDIFNASRPDVPVLDRTRKVRSGTGKVSAEILGIGISTGGPKALATLLPELPATFKIPIVIVQHMPKLFLESLAASLNEKCHLNVKVARHGEVITGGNVYLAPGEQQMAVEFVDGKNVIALSDDPPENFCKPAVDFLFRSLARNFKSRTIGLVMTGMGSDGANGLLEMKNAGGCTIAQDKETSTIYGMPREAYKKGAADVVLPLHEIGGYLQKITF